MTVAAQATSPRWHGRRGARVAALRILYGMEVGRLSLADAARLAGEVGAPDEGHVLRPDDHAFAVDLVRSTHDGRPSIDELISAAARNWRIERMVVVDRLLLRLAVCELTAFRDVPPRVVLDEAIELTREYSGDEAAAFVNGVLDGVLQRLRQEGRTIE